MTIKIFGVGNILLCDDGIGVHVVKALEKSFKSTDPVELIDAGTCGIDLLGLMESADKAIFIDAADMSLPPGTVKRFAPSDIVFTGELTQFSLHETGLLEVLEMANFLGIMPKEVVIYGIQPRDINYKIGLSDECEKAFFKLLDLVREEVKQSIIKLQA